MEQNCEDFKYDNEFIGNPRSPSIFSDEDESNKSDTEYL